MKIESPSFAAGDLDRYMDELVDRDRLRMAATLEALSERFAELGARVPAAAPSEERDWTAHEILAHIAVLSKFYGMLTYRVGSGQMTELDLLGNVNLRDVLGEQLAREAPAQLLELALADQARTAAYLRAADATAMRRTCVLDGGRALMSAADFARLPLIAHLEGHLDQLEAALQAGAGGG